MSLPPAALSLVEQLRVLAGASNDEDKFQIRRGDRIIFVQYTSGSTEALDVSIAVPTGRADAEVSGGAYRKVPTLVAPRPMDITLTLETESDRKGKRRGINREVQTGDPDFDHAVYIDSPSADHVLLRLFESSEARDAVRELLTLGCRHIKMDSESEGRIVLPMVEFVQRSPDQQRGARLVDALSRLACALPNVVASGKAAPKHPFKHRLVAGSVIAILGAQVVLPMGISCMGDCSHEGPGIALGWGLPLLGLTIGILLGMAIMKMLQKRIRGRSNSASTLNWAVSLTFLILAELGIILGRVLAYLL